MIKKKNIYNNLISDHSLFILFVFFIFFIFIFFFCVCVLLFLLIISSFPQIGCRLIGTDAEVRTS